MIENFVVNLGNILPFGYAFSAGMATAVSPCGIAMLPVYVSLHLGERDESFWARSSLWRCLRALALSIVVTFGFVVFFGVIGVVLSAGGLLLLPFIPWAAVFIGVVLVVLGIYLTLGGHVYTSLPARLAASLGKNGALGFKGFLIFGITYGIAALSCTLPIFLAVVGSALTTKGFASGLFQFVSFALGMGFIIMLVAIGSVLFKESVNRWLRRLVPVVARLSGLLLIFAGGYILYFWFVTGDILNWTS